MPNVVPIPLRLVLDPETQASVNKLRQISAQREKDEIESHKRIIKAHDLNESQQRVRDVAAAQRAQQQIAAAAAQQEALRAKYAKDSGEKIIAQIHAETLERNRAQNALRTALISGDAAAAAIHKKRIAEIAQETQNLRVLAIEKEKVQTGGVGALAGILGVGRTVAGVDVGGVLSSIGIGSVAATAGITALAGSFAFLIKEGIEWENTQRELQIGFQTTGLDAKTAAEAARYYGKTLGDLGHQYFLSEEETKKITAAYLKFGGTLDNLPDKFQVIIGLSERSGQSYEDMAKQLVRGTEFTAQSVRLFRQIGVDPDALKNLSELERFNLLLEKVQPTLKAMRENTAGLARGSTQLSNALSDLAHDAGSIVTQGLWNQYGGQISQLAAEFHWLTEAISGTNKEIAKSPALISAEHVAAQDRVIVDMRQIAERHIATAEKEAKIKKEQDDAAKRAAEEKKRRLKEKEDSARSHYELQKQFIDSGYALGEQGVLEGLAGGGSEQDAYAKSERLKLEHLNNLLQLEKNYGLDTVETQTKILTEKLAIVKAEEELQARQEQDEKEFNDRQERSDKELYAQIDETSKLIREAKLFAITDPVEKAKTAREDALNDLQEEYQRKIDAETENSAKRSELFEQYLAKKHLTFLEYTKKIDDAAEKSGNEVQKSFEKAFTGAFSTIDKTFFKQIDDKLNAQHNFAGAFASGLVKDLSNTGISAAGKLITGTLGNLFSRDKKDTTAEPDNPLKFGNDIAAQQLVHLSSIDNKLQPSQGAAIAGVGLGNGVGLDNNIGIDFDPRAAFNAAHNPNFQDANQQNTTGETSVNTPLGKIKYSNASSDTELLTDKQIDFIKDKSTDVVIHGAIQILEHIAEHSGELAGETAKFLGSKAAIGAGILLSPTDANAQERSPIQDRFARMGISPDKKYKPASVDQNGNPTSYVDEQGLITTDQFVGPQQPTSYVDEQGLITTDQFVGPQQPKQPKTDDNALASRYLGAGQGILNATRDKKHEGSGILGAVAGLLPFPFNVIGKDAIGGVGQAFGFAEGGETVTSKPTVIVTSEFGQSEHVRVTPLSKPTALRSGGTMADSRTYDLLKSIHGAIANQRPVLMVDSYGQVISQQRAVNQQSQRVL